MLIDKAGWRWGDENRGIELVEKGGGCVFVCYVFNFKGSILLKLLFFFKATFYC